MNTDQNDLLIRVDQNVINLVEKLNKHIETDETFQKVIWNVVNPLTSKASETRGAFKLAGTIYTKIIAGIGAIVGIKYGSK